MTINIDLNFEEGLNLLVFSTNNTVKKVLLMQLKNLIIQSIEKGNYSSNSFKELGIEFAESGIIPLKRALSKVKKYLNKSE